MSILESPIAQKTPHALICPCCQTHLSTGLETLGQIHFCEKCHGLWVDYREERHVLDLKPQVFTVDELRRFHKLYRPLGNIKPMRYMPCPVCRQLMYRKNWGGHSGVIVNKCVQHGTWFSTKEELEKINEFIALGGIEYEKLQLTEHGLSKINNRLTVEISGIKKMVLEIK